MRETRKCDCAPTNQLLHFNYPPSQSTFLKSWQSGGWNPACNKAYQKAEIFSNREATCVFDMITLDATQKALHCRLDCSLGCVQCFLTVRSALSSPICTWLVDRSKNDVENFIEVFAICGVLGIFNVHRMKPRSNVNDGLAKRNTRHLLTARTGIVGKS